MSFRQDIDSIGILPIVLWVVVTGGLMILAYLFG